VAAIVFVTLSFVWNVVQAYVFVQERFRPPEDREQFDGRDHIMLTEVYADARKSPGRDAVLESLNQNVTLMHHNIQELHAWHDKNDEDGIKLWYIPRTHIRRMDALYCHLSGEGVIPEPIITSRVVSSHSPSPAV